MNREQVGACIQDTGLIPAIRVHAEADAIYAATAVFRGGIPIAEITMTAPGAMELIGRVHGLAGECRGGRKRRGGCGYGSRLY